MTGKLCNSKAFFSHRAALLLTAVCQANFNRVAIFLIESSCFSMCGCPKTEVMALEDELKAILRM